MKDITPEHIFSIVVPTAIAVGAVIIATQMVSCAKETELQKHKLEIEAVKNNMCVVMGNIIPCTKNQSSESLPR